MNLEEALRELAQARQTLSGLQEDWAQARYDMDHTPEGVAFAAADSITRFTEQRVKEIEASIRQEAVAAYDGNKHPIEGVDLAEYQTVTYDRAEAIKWCVSNAPKYLALDTKPFEKAAPVLVDLGAPVQLGVEVRARIAGDLSQYLPSDLPNLGAPVAEGEAIPF